jgi:23S rRNA-/tRNA-specific pseudouridylate synthase
MDKEALIYEEEQGVRLDRFLTDSFPSLSRNYFEKAISRGGVLVNGNPSKKSRVFAPRASGHLPRSYGHSGPLRG